MHAILVYYDDTPDVAQDKQRAFPTLQDGAGHDSALGDIKTHTEGALLH